ncbi:MAG: hypothetical protein ACJ75M_24585, partial [Actinomycetes bacterium]
MGRLLGDPEVWDDSPARPRPAVRGLAGLAAGAVAGLLLAFAVVPRPDPPPPEVRLAPSAEAPRLRVEKQLLYSASIGGGPMLVSRSGRLEQVNADGTERRVVAQNLRASAVVGPDRAGVLAAVDSGVVTRVEANGTTRRLQAAAGKGAVVDGLALSPDGKLVAVSAGRPGRPWLVLVVGVDGWQLASIPLAGGHRPAWLGWPDRQGSTTLAVAAVDRRGDLATAELAARLGSGYVLAWQPEGGSARVLASGVPMVAADGF